MGETTRQGRKKKHLLLWRGPLQITERLGTTTFKVEDRRGKKYMRHLANMRPWRGPVPKLTDETLTPPQSSVDELRKNEFVFACERAGDQMFHLLKIKEIIDLDITAQVYGTTGKKVATAKCTPVYTRGDEIILSRYSQAKGARPWIWTLLLDDIEELVLAQGIILSKKGKLNAESRSIVKRLKPRELRVFT